MRLMIVVIVLVAGLGVCQASRAAGGGADFHVAATGRDDGPGTRDKPFASLGRARDAVRAKIAGGLTADVTVLVHGGTYRLHEPLVLTAADSGTDKHAVTYAAAPGEAVTISGGRRITGFRRGEGKLWVAAVPDVKAGRWHFRQLYVNGRRCVRARMPNADAKAPCWALKGAALSKDLKQYTLTFAPGLVKAWANASDMEVWIAGNWAINRKRVERVDAAAGVLVLAPPHAEAIRWNRPRPGRWAVLENAREFLDQPGEWHLDPRTGQLTYWPRDGEDMARAEVFAPVLARLVELKGTADGPVRNVHFRGLRFAHAAWPLPAGGYLGVQACHFSTAEAGGKKGWRTIGAAIECEFARSCSFTRGEIAHVGGVGIRLGRGCRGNTIEGSAIFDISANGVMVGGPRDAAGLAVGNRVANNHVHDCGLDFEGSVGIWAGITEGTVIAHNLVHDTPYTGISVGWQWNPQPTPCKKNVIENNHIYRVMKRLCDGGGIYTLGFQPGTVIRGNHIHDSRRSRFAQGAPNNGMFIDEGSKGFLFERNVIYDTSGKSVRFNQCRREWHTWKDNHFAKARPTTGAARDIIARAGIQEQYRKPKAP